VAATAASTLSDKPRWEKDIEPLVDTAAWNPGKRLLRSTPERHADLHGIFGNADRRLIQDIAFRYRAASSRNIGANWPKSMDSGRKRRKSSTFLQTSGSESPLIAPDALAGVAARDVSEFAFEGAAQREAVTPLQFGERDPAYRFASSRRALRPLSPAALRRGHNRRSASKADSATIPRHCTYRARERDNSANVSVQDRRLRLVRPRGLVDDHGLA
jgi:hypothetical protein